MNRPLSVVLAGGGTGGHIEPAMNLADCLRRRDPQTRITALGTIKGLETELVPARGYDLRLIPAVPLPRRPNKDLLTLPARVRQSVRATAEVLSNVNADVLVGFGGYVSVPGYLAARRSKVPIVVHESNARAGLANRLGARMTPFVVENYAGSLPHAQRFGVPLRPTVAHLDRAAQRQQARATLGLEPDGPVLLVFGGSQGARRINEAIWTWLPRQHDNSVQVLHAYGPRTQAPGELDLPAGVTYRGVPYIDRMDLAYAAADLALCRAGAMTCGEVAAVGLPAVYVPYPIGNGEQSLNAQPVVDAGGGLLVEDAQLDAQWLTSHVTGLLGDPARLDAMSLAAGAYGRRDGDERLADLVIRAGGSGA